MSGTNQKNPRCIALAGTPGKNACCTIYENRSSTCREFAMSGENGEINEACNRARAKYGLTPIFPDTGVLSAVPSDPVFQEVGDDAINKGNNRHL